MTDSMRVRILRVHHNAIAAAYYDFFCCYRCVCLAWRSLTSEFDGPWSQCWTTVSATTGPHPNAQKCRNLWHTSHDAVVQPWWRSNKSVRFIRGSSRCWDNADSKGSFRPHHISSNKQPLATHLSGVGIQQNCSGSKTTSAGNLSTRRLAWNRLSDTWHLFRSSAARARRSWWPLH